MANTFLKILLDNVSLVFKKCPEFDDSGETKKKEFSSKNKIPRKIRILMRNKSKLSKQILRAKSPLKYMSLVEKLETIEEELKTSYEERRSNQENEALKRMKKDPKVFFQYAKKFK